MGNKNISCILYSPEKFYRELGELPNDNCLLFFSFFFQILKIQVCFFIGWFAPEYITINANIL